MVGLLATTRALGFRQSLLIAVLVALASFLGAFTPVDGRLYDVYVRNSPDLQNKAPQVLLIDSPVSAFFAADFPWERLVGDLVALGARQVVFTVFPEGDSNTAQALRDHPAVILGTDLMPDPEHAESMRLNLSPAFGSMEPHAVAETAESLLGVHRYQRYSYQVGDRTFPSVEALSARRLGKNLPDQGRFLINFGQSGQAFPRVKLKQALQGGLVKDFVAGRVVLIGIGQERFHRTVVTPITGSKREVVTKLDYHGYALNSLLNGNSIASLAPLTKSVLVLATWLVFFLVAQPMGFRGAMVAGTLMIGVLVVLAWLMLIVMNVHVPVLGSALVIGTTLVSFVQRKTQHHDRALTRLVNAAGMAQESGLADHRIPRGEEFWPNAMGMVDQAVPVTRAMLLERLPGSARLRPVHALRCAHDVLVDPAPDLTRPPFASAAAALEIAEAEGLLKPIPGERHQFVAPLASQSEVLGYLVFGTGMAEEHHPAMLRAVMALCRRLTEMIEANRQHSSGGAVRSSFADRYLAGDRDEAVARLNEHLQLAIKHSEFLVAALNRLRTPTMVYDLFGRPLFTNTSMKPVLKEARLNPEEGSSAADLIEHTCGLTSEQARLALTDLTVEGKELDRLAWVGTQQYRLKGDVLGGTSLAETSYQDMVQQAHGVLFQLVPVVAHAEPRVAAKGHTEQVASATDSDVWLLLERAISEVSVQPDFEGLTIDVEGERAPARVATAQWMLHDLLLALVQLLAYDSKLPGRIEVEVRRGGSRILVAMRNQGFGMPDARLQAMLVGPVWPQSATLRRIRQLRDTALGTDATLELTSSVGSGYRVLLAMETLV